MDQYTGLSVKAINFKDENFDIEHQPFWVQDTYCIAHDIFDEVLYCEQLFVPKENRRKGVASKWLQDYIKENIGDDKLLFAQAGFSTKEYTLEEYKSATAEERETLFYNLDKFYTKNGFFNINDFIGNYEEHVMYLYINEAAVKLIEKIVELSKSHKRFSSSTTSINTNDIDEILVRKKDGTQVKYKTYIKHDQNNEIYGEYIDASEDEIKEISEIDYFNSYNFIKLINGLAIKISHIREFNLNYIFIIRLKDNIINCKKYALYII